MLDQKKFLIIGGILAVVVIVVTLVVVLTRKKDASGGGGGGDNFSPCGNIVTLPNGTQAICPIGWDNRWTTRKNDMKNPNLVRIAAECDEDKDQCMACIGPLYVKTDQLVEEHDHIAPGPAYPEMPEWPLIVNQTKNEKALNKWLEPRPDGSSAEQDPAYIWSDELDMKRGPRSRGHGLAPFAERHMIVAANIKAYLSDSLGSRILVTNPLPLPPGVKCAASDANGVLL